MRVCAEKNCSADISNRRGNATLCLECAKNRHRSRERTKSSRAELLKISTVKPPGAAPCRRSTAGLSKGKAAMKRYQQSAKGQAASRTARKKWLESPKGRAALQALRERNKEHQKAYRESPRAGHGLRSRMGE